MHEISFIMKTIKGTTKGQVKADKVGGNRNKNARQEWNRIRENETH